MECLSKLLTSIFEKKLTSLEQSASSQFTCIQSTMTNIKHITAQCVSLSQRISKQYPKLSSNKQMSHSKTPKKAISTLNVCNSACKGKYNKTLYKSKSNGSLLQSKSVPRSIKSMLKTKSCTNLVNCYAKENNRETTSPNNVKTNIKKIPELQLTAKKPRKSRNLTSIDNNNSTSYSLGQHRSPSSSHRHHGGEHQKRMVGV